MAGKKYFKVLDSESDIVFSSTKETYNTFGDVALLQYTASNCVYTGSGWTFLESGSGSELLATAQRFYLYQTSTGTLTTSHFSDMFIGLGYDPDDTCPSSSENIYCNASLKASDLLRVRYGIYSALRNKIVNDPQNEKFMYLSTNTDLTVASLASHATTAVLGISTKRSDTRDELSPGNWNIKIAGNISIFSASNNDCSYNAHLNAPFYFNFVDNSSVNPTGSTGVYGVCYDVISGSIDTASDTTTLDSNGTIYGKFYPQLGLILLDIGWHHQTSSAAATTGWFPNTRFSAWHSASNFYSESADSGSSGTGGYNVESLYWYSYTTSSDLTQWQFSGSTFANPFYYYSYSNLYLQSCIYFCRGLNTEFNFSSNKSFGNDSGSLLDSMLGSPTTYITGVGLYNDLGELMAVGKLGQPEKKSSTDEVTIKVRLDY